MIKKTFVFVLVLNSQTVLAEEVSNHVWNLAWESNSLFVDRDCELKQIEKILKKNHAIAIYGMSGIGKSSLATRYADNKKEEYKIVWKFDNYMDINNEFLKFAKFVNTTNLHKDKLSVHLKDDIVDIVKNFLRTANFPWLIIFDNIEQFATISKFIPFIHAGSSGHIIFVSRRIQNIDMDNIKLVELTSENLARILLKITGENDKKVALSFINKYEIFNTLDLINVATKIKNTPSLSIAKYQKSIKRGKHLIYDEVLATIEQIKRKNSSAFLLLQVLSFMKSAFIQEDLLTIWFMSFGYDLSDFHEALGCLNNYLILNKKVDSLDKNKISFGIHDKYQMAVFQIISRKEIDRILSHIFDSSLKIINEQKKPIMGNVGLHIVGQLVYPVKFANKFHYCSNSLIQIELMMLENYLHNKRDRNECENIINTLENKFSERRIDKLLKISYLTKSAMFYFQKGDIEESIKKQNMAFSLLSLSDKSNPANLEEYLEANNYMLKYLLANGDLTQAKIYYKIMKKFLLDDNTGKILDKITVAYSKAHFYESESYINSLSGNYSAALESIDKALNNAGIVAEYLHLKEFPYYICAHIFAKKYFYLSVLNKDSNTYNELFAIYKKSLKQASSLKNKAIGVLMVILGERQGVVGSFDEAKKTIMQGINILDEWYEGKNNKNLGHARILLGDLYTRHGYMLEAQNEYLLALKILRKEYKFFNTDDVSRLLYKIAFNSLQLNDIFNAKQFINMHINIFGVNHVRSIDLSNEIQNRLFYK